MLPHCGKRQFIFSFRVFQVFQVVESLWLSASDWISQWLASQVRQAPHPNQGSSRSRQEWSLSQSPISAGLGEPKLEGPSLQDGDFRLLRRRDSGHLARLPRADARMGVIRPNGPHTPLQFSLPSSILCFFDIFNSAALTLSVWFCRYIFRSLGAAPSCFPVGTDR